jgi:hypothetical protein
MLTLDLTNTPRWHDLAPGVRVQLRPLTTALMVATRSDPAVESLPHEASDEERALAFARPWTRRPSWRNRLEPPSPRFTLPAHRRKIRSMYVPVG